MKDLIARLEASNGPDRELDGEILECALDYMWDRSRLVFVNLMAKPQYYTKYHLPKFTSSVDAALTLLPNGYEQLSNLNKRNQPEMGGRMWSASISSPSNIHSGGQRTPALAICIAALKARLHDQSTAAAITVEE